MKRVFVCAVGMAVLFGSLLIATLVPIKGCFDNGTCVTMSLLHSEAGFSQYWSWDYRWGVRIVAIVIGPAAALIAFAVTSRNDRARGA